MQLQTMLIDAMVLGMLGCIDSMLTSVIADNIGSYRARFQ
jgi:SulP family sulfate permease